MTMNRFSWRRLLIIAVSLIALAVVPFIVLLIDFEERPQVNPPLALPTTIHPEYEVDLDLLKVNLFELTNEAKSRGTEIILVYHPTVFPMELETPGGFDASQVLSDVVSKDQQNQLKVIEARDELTINWRNSAIKLSMDEVPKHGVVGVIITGVSASFAYFRPPQGYL